MPSNTPIMAIDADGLEAANAISAMKAKINGVESLKLNNVSDGFGNIQEQRYSLHSINPVKDVNTLYNEFASDPNSVLGTEVGGSFYYKKQQNEGTITKGDYIGINPSGLKGFDIYVKVADVKKDENSFSVSFRTLDISFMILERDFC
jgi:hypothetical protein